MKRLLMGFIAATLAAGTAHAEFPAFTATCPGNLKVVADAKGTVRINGKKAKIKKLSDEAYDAKGAGVTVSVGLNPDHTLSVFYTGKHRANGVCQVQSAGAAGKQESAAPPAGAGAFNATGKIPCAQHKGQPMTQCAYGVQRGPGGSGTVTVTLPDGRTRAIFFEKGRPVSADLSQADGNMSFHVVKESDLFTIKAGNERYEIPEAVITGG